jgi:hypothetical protein
MMLDNIPNVPHTNAQPSESPAAQPSESPATPTGPPDDLIPADPAEAIQFALGVLDVMSTLCATLIGCGVVEPNAFQDEMGKRAALAREMGQPSRAASSQLFLDRLQALERVKREAVADIVAPSSLTNRMN